MQRIANVSAALVALSVCTYAAIGAGRAAGQGAGHDEARIADFADRLSGPPEGTLSPYDLAYEACVDKEEGMACSVAVDRLQFEGSCVLALDQRLICLPDEEPADR